MEVELIRLTTEDDLLNRSIHLQRVGLQDLATGREEVRNFDSQPAARLDQTGPLLKDTLVFTPREML
jgi:hypothetical protein